MNIDPIIPSILHITAKENVDISQDLQSTQQKSLGQLIEETYEEKETEENKQG